MMGQKRFPSAVIALLLPFAFFFGACSGDTPTEPESQAQQPPTTTPSATWNVSVTASPAQFEITEGAGVSFIQVRATRVSNGQPVARDTTAVLTSSAGILSTTTDSGTRIPIKFEADGVARAQLDTGAFTSPGTIVVRAQIESSFGSATIEMIEEIETTGNFGITDIRPNFGPPSGGTMIEVFGSDFEFPLKAVFCTDCGTFAGGFADGIALTDVQVLSASRFTAVTPRIDLPAGDNLTMDLAIESNGASGISADVLPGAFTYTRNVNGPAQLLLISVTPASGPNEGGTQVTIRGDGFNSQAQVFFSNGPLIEATVIDISSTVIRAITPSATGPNADNANSIVSVTVRDPISGQEATLSGAFQYGASDSGLFISAVGPNEVAYTGGTLVTIYGQGFDEPVAVEAGGIGQTPISVTGTEIVFRASAIQLDSCSEEEGPVEVTNIETGESVTGPNFIYRAIEPVILSVVPGFGPQGGGNTVNINGVATSFSRGFDPPVRVLFNGRPAIVNSISPDRSVINVTVPQFTGTFNTEECVDGTGETGERRIDTAVDVEVENVPTGCFDSVVEAYIYNPDDTTCVVDSAAGGGPISPGGGAPVASFSTTINPGGANPLLVQFTDTSSPGSGATSIVSWAWTFGDGGSSIQQNPSHTYAVGGTYSVNLTVTDDIGGVAQVSQNVTVP